MASNGMQHLVAWRARSSLWAGRAGNTQVTYEDNKEAKQQCFLLSEPAVASPQCRSLAWASGLLGIYPLPGEEQKPRPSPVFPDQSEGAGVSLRI